MALIDIADVEHLFQGLVEVLAERDPGRLHSSFQVAELYQQIIPYRVYRSRLGFDTNQDYEGAVLGLLGGLGNYAAVEPPEAQETLAAEAASPNPDLSLFHEFAGARVRLNPARVRGLLDRSSAYAPPEPESASPPSPPPPVFVLDREQRPPADAAPARAEPELRCGACDRVLPAGRAVVFCPWCGSSVGAPACTRCGDELDAEWRFCPRCGERQRT